MRSCFICAVVLSSSLAGVAGAATLTVDAAGGGDHSTIGDALAAASAGDVIEVAAGTYTEDIDFLGKDVTVVSSDGVGAATITGTGSGPVVSFTTSEGPGAILDGFVITGGDATGTYFGGGVHVNGADPTLRDLEIHDNLAWIGAGILLADSEATLDGVHVHDNEAQLDTNGSWGYGGGLYAFDCDVGIDGLVAEANTAVRGGGFMLGDCTADLTNITATGNDADRGGGFSIIGGEVTLEGATIDANTATVVGGGFYLSSDAGLTLTNAVVTANSAPTAGGGRIADSSPTVDQCTFDGNSATDNAGALLIDVINGAATPTVSSTLFHDNTATVGGAVLIDEGAPYLVGNVFTDNAASNLGGAIYVADAGATTISVCTFDGNSSVSDGGAVRFQGGLGHGIDTSIFHANSASNGAAVHVAFGAEVTIQHTTVVGNAASSGGSLRVTSDSALTVRNSIVAFPTSGSGITAGSGSTWTIEYNDVWNTTGPEFSGSLPDLTGSFGNLSVDPEFVDYTSDGVANDNLHLALGSPCIDAGDPIDPDEPDGTAPDMGAYGGTNVGLWTTLPEAGAPGGPVGDDDDDDDATGDDDDSAGDDDDSTGDDDDSGTTGDDDDSTSGTFGDDDDATPPPTEGCDCSASGSDGASALYLLPALLALRRRRT